MKDIVDRILNKDVSIDKFIIDGGKDFDYLFNLCHSSHSTGATLWVYPITKKHKPFTTHWSDMKVFIFRWIAQLYFNHLKKKHKDKIITKPTKE